LDRSLEYNFYFAQESGGLNKKGDAEASGNFGTNSNASVFKGQIHRGKSYQ